MSKGNIYHREEFLQTIAKNLRRKPRLREMERPKRKYRPEPKVYATLSATELLQVMRDECDKIHTELLETDQASLPKVLAKQIGVHGNGSIVIPEDPRFIDYGLDGVLSQEDVHTWDPSRGDENITHAEQANIGIMFSDITLAESATTVIFNNKNKARAISLLPTTFIAIIPKHSIVPRMTQAAQIIEQQIKAGETIPSCVNLISGPSNSADIEYNLVVGVHGPIKASYIVVD